MAADGGLVHVDVDSGRTERFTPDAARPLAVLQDRLLCQAEPRRSGILVLRVLDARSGHVLHATDVELPASVVARLAEQLGESFDVRAEPDGGGFVVRWEARRQRITGRDSGGSRTVRGGVRIDVATGRATPLDATTPPAPGVPSGLRRLIDGGVAPASAWQTGAWFVATMRGPSDCLVLRRWDAATAAPSPDVPIGCDRFLTVAAAADGRHVLVSRHGATPGATPYRWTIHAVETGARVGEVPAEATAAPFVVRDDVLVDEVAIGRDATEGDGRETLELRGLDLRTGAQRWSVPLRNTRYRGPLPQRDSR